MVTSSIFNLIFMLCSSLPNNIDLGFNWKYYKRNFTVKQLDSNILLRSLISLGSYCLDDPSGVVLLEIDCLLQNNYYL